MLTNKRISEEIGCLEARVSDWKNGRRGISLADARLIQDRLGLSLEFILYDKPERVYQRIVKVLERQIK